MLAGSKQKVKKKGPPDPAVPPEQRDAEYWRDPSENLFVDFGPVVFGEWSTRQVTIHNSGALPANYTIREAVIEDEPKPELERQNEYRKTRMYVELEQHDKKYILSKCIFIYTHKNMI